MKIAVIETGLFPDEKTVESAIDQFNADHIITRYKLVAQGRSLGDWERMLAEIVSSDKVLTV